MKHSLLDINLLNKYLVLLPEAIIICLACSITAAIHVLIRQSDAYANQTIHCAEPFDCAGKAAPILYFCSVTPMQLRQLVPMALNYQSMRLHPISTALQWKVYDSIAHWCVTLFAGRAAQQY